MSINKELVSDLNKAQERIAELEQQCDDSDRELQDALNHLAALRESNEELRGQGNLTAAEYLEEWWGQSNVQGVAEMTGEEMLEIACEMASSRPPEQEKGE